MRPNDSRRQARRQRPRRMADAKWRVCTVLALATLCLVAPPPSLAVGPPHFVNYQGVLRDPSGAPRNGSFDMTFRFFDAHVDGNEILVDEHLASGTGAVVVGDGLFDVTLGGGDVSDGVDPLPGDPYLSLARVFEDYTDVWMQIEIGGEVLAPRVRILSSPYALQARTALDALSADVASEALSLGGLGPSSYLNTSPTGQTKIGNLRTDGLLIAGGNQLRFNAPGAVVSAGETALVLEGGDQPTDDLVLRAGFSVDGGSGMIHIDGESQMTFWSGNGRFQFMNGATLSGTGVLTEDGTFVARELVAENGSLNFLPSGALVGPTASNLTISSGYDDTDDLFLRAGNDNSDGSIILEGDGAVTMRAGNGNFVFFDGSTSAVLAQISPTGTIVAQDDLAAWGDSLFLGDDEGTRLTTSSTALEILAGNENTDDLLLRAGNEFTDGSIEILGDGAISLRAGNGAFSFVNGATGGTLATLASTGTLTATQDLVALGEELHLGTPGTTRMVHSPTFDDLALRRDDDNNNLDARFAVFAGGIEQMRIEDGDEAEASFDGPVTANGLDYAEAFWISDPTLRAGEVVAFDPARPGFITRATEAYSRHLVGVISEKPGFVTGGSFDAEEAADPELASKMRDARAAGDHETAREISVILDRKRAEQQRPVALAGRLPVLVDAKYGPIQAGDPLTSSETPGHARALKDAGPSIGVALESFGGPGTGVILAFVERGHYTPSDALAQARAAQEELAQTLAARTPDPATGVQVLSSNLQLVLGASGEAESRFSIFRDGAATAPRAEVFRVDERGNVFAQGAFRPRSMDVAEAFAVSEPVEPGDVLAVDRENPGLYRRSRQAGDPGVVGVVAADPGVLLGGDITRVLGASPELALALAEARAAFDPGAEQAAWDEMEQRFRATHAAVALSGTVAVKVDAGYGAIEPGDLLIASPTPGHAMRAPDPALQGTVLGKALEPLASGVGTIRMLVVVR